MLTEAQHAARAQGLGSSDLPAVVGLSPHRSALDVYAEKVGLVPPAPETPAQRAGSCLEAGIARLYALETGARLAPGDTVAHPAAPWALATPDFYALDAGPRRLVECKLVGRHNARAWGAPGTDAVPPHYLAQVVWQMGVVGLRTADVAALIDHELCVYTVAFDADLWRALVARARAFWFDHVLPRVAPPLDGSPAAARLLAALHPRDTDGLAPAPAEATPLAEELLALRAQRAALEAREAELETALKAAIGDRAGLDGPGWRATWKAAGGGGTDWKRVAGEAGATPELVARHARPGPRKFLITAKGDGR